MNSIKSIFVSMTLLAVTSFASAEYYGDDRNIEFAQVVDVQPIYETVRVPENRRVCRDDRRSRRGYGNRRQYSSHRSNSGGGAILGGIIGGLLGNRFGDGRGRDTATAIGIMAGSAIGSQAGNSRYDDRRRYSRHDSRNRRNACYGQRRYHQEERVVAYNVTYDYNGRVYHTTMQNHPGDRVRVNVNVQLAEY